MTKRLLLLNGLAVLMVPFHHSTAFGLQAMFEWADRYRSVSVPNYDLLGSLAYYVLLSIRQLDAYAIPAFFFVSGFFVAFMARGQQLTWDLVTPRIKVFLVPLAIWTTIRFILLQRPPATIFELLDTYYFIVLVIQYYILSLVIVPLARKDWKLVLILTVVIQFAAGSPFYLKLIGVDIPGVALLDSLTPRWLFPSRIFYFTLGLVAGLNVNPFKEWLSRVRWHLVVITIISGVLTFVEYAFLTKISGKMWIGPNNPGIMRIIYSITLPLCFLAFNEIYIPFSKVLSDLGSKSLGIYMVNVPAIYAVAVLMYRFTPWALGVQPIYQAVLVMAGIGIPLLLMEITRRSPRRIWYRYIFG